MTKKIGIIIGIILIAYFGLLNSEETESHNVIIGTFTWAQSSQEIFLLPGIYHFDFTGTITTDIPFDEYNLWEYRAIIDGVSSYSQYGSTCSPSVNSPVGDTSPNIVINESGYYLIRAGIKSIYGCSVTSDQANLIRTCSQSLK